MKSKLPADDLFEKSSMSFGDHLEELRKALGKALLWLGGGAIIGLMLANHIVKFVETPLKQAISDFHIAQAEAQYLAANGEEPTDALKGWMKTEGMMPERVFIDPLVLASTAGTEIQPRALGPDAGVDRSASAEREAETDPPVATPDRAPAGASPPRTAPTESSQNDEASTAANPTEKAKEPAPQPETNQVVPQVIDEGTIQPLSNPWTGISLEKLQRLEPMLLWRPIPNKLISLNPVEGFMIWLKAGLVAGVVIGSPGIFWHVWQFLAAGLYPHERRYVYWYLPLSLILFLGGVSLAFFVVFRMVLAFLMQYSTGLDVEFTPRLNDYMSFALFLPLGFGIAFQLPIAMLGLHRFGLVSMETFRSQWRIAVLAIAFLSMMLSPPDIYSMFGLFFPLVLLYFFGIALCKYMPTGAGIGAPAIDPQA